MFYKFKIYFILFIFFIPLNLFSVYIILDSNTVKEGDPIKIKIKNEKILQAAEIEFLNKKIPIFFEKFDLNERLFVYSCIIPVPLGTSNKKEIKIKILQKNQILEKIEKVNIKKIKSRKSIVNSEKMNNQFLDDITNENNFINNLQNEIISAKFSFPFVIPVEGEITTDFGLERIYNNGLAKWRHKGIDIYAQKGTPVKAANNGIISGAYFSKVHGNFVIINHGAGIYTLYFHLQKVYVKNKQKVYKNDIIGTVGDTGLATGPHLHWQINVLKIPANPKEFLKNW